MTQPADTLRAAADVARDSLALPPYLRGPLAGQLTEVAKLHEPLLCEKHEGCDPLGCQWCADEDWPCADVRGALAVARALLGDVPAAGTDAGSRSEQ